MSSRDRLLPPIVTSAQIRFHCDFDECPRAFLQDFRLYSTTLQLLPSSNDCVAWVGADCVKLGDGGLHLRGVHPVGLPSLYQDVREAFGKGPYGNERCGD